MGQILTGEVFEEIMNRLKGWLGEGLDGKESDEVLKIGREFMASALENRFGQVVETDRIAEDLRSFYSRYFDSPQGKFIFFKKWWWTRKYSVLKEESSSLAKKVLAKGETNRDIAEDAKIILNKTEKLNFAIEKEPEEVQSALMEYVKEIFLNCQFASTGDKGVLGKEIGDLVHLIGAGNEEEWG